MIKLKKLLSITLIGLCVFTLPIKANAYNSVSKSIAIDVSRNTSVLSDADGVIHIIDNTSFEIEHTDADLITVYSDIDEVLVYDGQEVVVGDVVGKDGDSFGYSLTVDSALLNYDLGIDPVNPVTKSISEEIADYALLYVGNPYVWGGTSLTNGADCSGFVQTLYKTYGNMDIPRTCTPQYAASTHISEDDMRKGDLIFYTDDAGGISHVAIYLGDGRIVHASNSAPYPKGGIKISENYKYRGIVGIGRFE